MAAKKTPRAEKAKASKKAAKPAGSGQDVKARTAKPTASTSKPTASAKAGASSARSAKAKAGAPPPAAQGKPAKAKKAPAKASAAPATKRPAARASAAEGRSARRPTEGSDKASARSRGRGRSGARRHSELTPKIIAKLRQKLLEKHRDLVGAVRSSKGDSREQTTDGTEDYIDYAVSSYDREFLLSLTELEQRELRRVEEALRRMDRGEYGFCQASGEEIPLKRLEAQPWARYCLRVQELEDQGLLEQDDFDGQSDNEEESSFEEPDYEDLDEEEEAEEEEGELEYRDEIPTDESLGDPDAEERVV